MITIDSHVVWLITIILYLTLLLLLSPYPLTASHLLTCGAILKRVSVICASIKVSLTWHRCVLIGVVLTCGRTNHRWSIGDLQPIIWQPPDRCSNSHLIRTWVLNFNKLYFLYLFYRRILRRLFKEFYFTVYNISKEKIMKHFVL